MRIQIHRRRSADLPPGRVAPPCSMCTIASVSCACVSCCCLTGTRQPDVPCRNPAERGAVLVLGCSEWQRDVLRQELQRMDSWGSLDQAAAQQLAAASQPAQQPPGRAPQVCRLSWLQTSCLPAACPAEPAWHPPGGTLHVCVATAGRPSLPSCFQVALCMSSCHAWTRAHHSSWQLPLSLHCSHPSLRAGSAHLLPADGASPNWQQRAHNVHFCRAKCRWSGTCGRDGGGASLRQVLPVPWTQHGSPPVQTGISSGRRSCAGHTQGEQ